MKKQLAVFLAIVIIGALGFSLVPISGVSITTSDGYLSISTDVVLAVNTVEEPASNPVGNPPMTWYDSNYTYRKSFNITNTTAGAQTNYQMKLLVSKNSGSDGSGTVNLSGHCQDDFDDIRFTNTTGAELDYWTETVNSGANATVWVELDSVSATGNTPFYIYYGNSTVSSASNGDNTFLFFDDFTGDLTKWTIKSGTWEIDTNRLKYTAGIKSNIIYGNVQVPANYRAAIQFISMASWDKAAGPYAGIGDYVNDAYAIAATKNEHTNSAYRGLTITKHESEQSRVWHEDGADHIDSGELYWEEFTKDGNDGKAYVRNANWAEQCHLYYTHADIGGQQGYIAILGYGGRDEYLNQVFLASFCSPEPTWGAWGSEETGVTAPTVTNGVGATNITTTTARLNGNLTDDGGENCMVHFFWGDEDWEEEIHLWDHMEALGALGEGAFYRDIANLTSSTTYYYRTRAFNTPNGAPNVVWANTTKNFTTVLMHIDNTPASYDFGGVEADSNYVTGLTNFNVTNTGDCAINISIQGLDMETAILLESSEGLTAGVADGTLVYNGYLYLTGRNGYVTRINTSNYTDVTSVHIARGENYAGMIDAIVETDGYIWVGDFAGWNGDYYATGRLYKLYPTNLTTVSYWNATTSIGAMCTDDTYIYLGEAAGWIERYEVSTSNITSNDMGLDLYCHSICEDGDYLYGHMNGAYGHSSSITAYPFKIAKSDLSLTTNTSLSGVFGDDIVQDDDYFYIFPHATTDVNGPYRLAKTDLSSSNCSLGITYGLDGLALSNNTLMITEYEARSSTHYLHTINKTSFTVIGRVSLDGVLALDVNDIVVDNDYIIVTMYAVDTDEHVYAHKYNRADILNYVYWALSDTATPGADTYGLKAGLNGGDYTTTVKGNSPYNNLCSNLSVDATQGWGLKLYTPTSFSDNNEKTGTVTLTATEA